MKWLKMHAQYDDAHPWEALEIICTLAGMNPSKQLQADLRQAVCKSYDYMYLFLERCMQLERRRRWSARERLDPRKLIPNVGANLLANEVVSQ
jgi:pyrroloquinoline quinone (PQQ) biosynthesis protein C